MLLTNRINRKANFYLGFVPIIIALWNCWVLSIDLDLYQLTKVLNWIPLQFVLALGPCLYFYTKHITNSSFQFQRKHLIHFIPVLLELLVFFIQAIESSQKNIPQFETDLFFSVSPIIQFAGIVSVLFYSFQSLKAIKRYQIYIQNNYSNDRRYNLNWLYRLLVIISILWFLWVPYTLIDFLIFDYKLGIAAYYPLYILMAIITIWISAEAFLRPEIVLVEANTIDSNSKVEISSEIIKEAQWLKLQMEANLFYLDSELTLRSLATELDIHPNNLSRLINDGLSKSFSDFVNEYRTEAVISKLNDPKYTNITLLGIAFDSGFNSKTTFNRVFKKVTGKTPAAYKASQE